MSERRLIPVENHRTLGRDPHSKAIINNDVEGLRKAKELQARARARDTQMNMVGERINKLESDMDQIKSILTTILEELKK